MQGYTVTYMCNVLDKNIQTVTSIVQPAKAKKTCNVTRHLKTLGNVDLESSAFSALRNETSLNAN